MSFPDQAGVKSPYPTGVGPEDRQLYVQAETKEWFFERGGLVNGVLKDARAPWNLVWVKAWESIDDEMMVETLVGGRNVTFEEMAKAAGGARSADAYRLRWWEVIIAPRRKTRRG